MDEDDGVIKEEDSDTNNEEGDNESELSAIINNIYVLNETEYTKEELSVIMDEVKKQVKTDYTDINAIEGECIDNKDGVILRFKIIDGALKVHVITTKNTSISEDATNQLGTIMLSAKTIAMYESGKVEDGKVNMLGVPFYASSSDGIADEEDEAVDIAKIIMPMIFCLFMYMIIMIYGQTISKAIIADKASKLIETLLTSVKPYAIIGGKIAGSVFVAVVQTFIFIIAGVIGYFVGDIIASDMSSKHVNFIGELIKLLSNSSDGSAFSLISIIIAVLAVVTGFMLYCTLAGFSASFATKVEDMSSTLSIFMIPLMIGFMGSYLAIVSTLGANGMETNNIVELARYIPITSPFMLSADILVGNISIFGGIISYAIMVATTVILIIATGKIYKGKIFNTK